MLLLLIYNFQLQFVDPICAVFNFVYTEEIVWLYIPDEHNPVGKRFDNECQLTSTFWFNITFIFLFWDTSKCL
jgi:hypothetical protein